MTNITTTQNKSTTEEVTNKAGEVAATARAEAVGVVHDAKQQARRLAGESRDQLREQAGQQAQRLAQTMRDIGGQLQGMANGDAAPSGMLADLTQQAASSAHRVADSLDQKGVEGVVSDMKRFARQRPGLFIAGALGAGLIAGRVLRTMDTSAVMQAAKPGNESDNDQPQGMAPVSTPPVSTSQGPAIVGPAPLNRPTEF